MLSAETLATIKSTAPLLAEQGKAITDLFYSKLFAQHPELQHIFNMANQAQGEQSRALAESVFMYATHIDKLQNLGPMVSRIAHKHASLQVAPEHYPIVGKYLLEAIQDHLGLEADHPVLGAQPGDRVWVQPPTGDFTIKHPRPGRPVALAHATGRRRVFLRTQVLHGCGQSPAARHGLHGRAIALRGVRTQYAFSDALNEKGAGQAPFFRASSRPGRSAPTCRDDACLR